MTPFRGLRYDASIVGDVGAAVSPPYDVIGSEQAEALMHRSPYGSIRLELSQEAPTTDPGRYQRAAQTLRDWLADGALKLDDRPAIYRWEQAFPHQGRPWRREALVAAVRVEPWQTRAIRPHEDTTPRPKVDRLQLLRACHAQFSPIFGLYRDTRGRIARLLQVAESRPLLQAQDSLGIQHTLAAVNEPGTLQALIDAFAEEPVYLADGHHRYETAMTLHTESSLEGAAFVMMALVHAEDPALLILPTHRLVRGLPESTLDTLRHQLERGFHIAPQPLEAPTNNRSETRAPIVVFGLEPHTKLLLHPKNQRQLEERLPAARSAAWKRLAVSLLHGVILDELLHDVPQAKVAFIENEDEAITQVEEGRWQLAFLLEPPSPLDVLSVADAGDRMPEKSTYFYPKFPAGVVMYHLEHPPQR